MINFIWRIYTKLANYDQKVKDEFEYELWKKLEQKYHQLYTETEVSTKTVSTNTPDTYVSGYDLGRAYAYHSIWNDILDRYFHICDKLGRLDEFYVLMESRTKGEIK